MAPRASSRLWTPGVKLKMGKRPKPLLSLERLGNREAAAAAPNVEPEPVVDRGTENPGIVGPRSVVENTAQTISYRPQTAVGQGAIVGFFPAVLAPFPTESDNTKSGAGAQPSRDPVEEPAIF